MHFHTQDMETALRELYRHLILSVVHCFAFLQYAYAVLRQQSSTYIHHLFLSTKHKLSAKAAQGTDYPSGFAYAGSSYIEFGFLADETGGYAPLGTVAAVVVISDIFRNFTVLKSKIAPDIPVMSTSGAPRNVRTTITLTNNQLPVF